MSNDSKNEVVEFKAGDTIFREGDPSNYMLVIRTGQIEVFLSGRDKQKIPLSIINSGEFLGELSILSGKGRTATAVALTDVSAIKITKQTFESFSKTLPFWMSGLMSCLTTRIQRINELIRRNGLVDDTLMTQIEAAESKLDKAA